MIVVLCRLAFNMAMIGLLLPRMVEMPWYSLLAIVFIGSAAALPTGSEAMRPNTRPQPLPMETRNG
jgi:putative exporter of polyketide antibiotics